jgi:hypothetical protein
VFFSKKKYECEGWMIEEFKEKPIDMSVVELEDVYFKHLDITDNSRPFFVVDRKLKDGKFLVNIWKRRRSFDQIIHIFNPSFDAARVIDNTILTKDELAKDYFLVARKMEESTERANYEYFGL